jgi:hypothetical protein
MLNTGAHSASHFGKLDNHLPVVSIMGHCLLHNTVELAVGGRGRHQSVTAELLLKSKTDLCSVTCHHLLFSRRNIKALLLQFIDWLLTECTGITWKAN